MPQNVWKNCLDHLEKELSTQQFNIWIRPLQSELKDDTLFILSPNPIVQDWVISKFGFKIEDIIYQHHGDLIKSIKYEVGTRIKAVEPSEPANISHSPQKSQHAPNRKSTIKNNLNENYTFDNFVEGKSNQMARAAALQIGETPGGAYNPLFIYGGVGLGKTHLMHAIGNVIKQNNPAANVVYLHSERFVADMVKALQHNAINEFKRLYRTLDALLIDDIQFFAGKERSQEEFFHTFNALLEGQKQIILTCDTFPKEVKNLDERLKSRLGWGLTVSIDPPELETRVAILNRKAEKAGIDLPSDVSFFIAKHIRSNIRELEGALSRVNANAHFKGEKITLQFAKEALRDQLAIQAKQVTIENIQKIVAEYYKIRVNDLLSKRRNRSIARPRQMAMSLAKELTNHSLPEIGEAFGGRDHTTVLHACKKIIELKESDHFIKEDYDNLLRKITT